MEQTDVLKAAISHLNENQSEMSEYIMQRAYDNVKYFQKMYHDTKGIQSERERNKWRAKRDYSMERFKVFAIILDEPSKVMSELDRINGADSFFYKALVAEILLHCITTKVTLMEEITKLYREYYKPFINFYN